MPDDYPEAGGVAIVLVGVNGNIYYQFSNPAGAFRGFQSNGQPAAFRGNPFTINNPVPLNCGFSECPDYFGGGLANVYVRFTAFDGDTQPGGFDENDISLLLNGINIGSWSGLTTEATNRPGTTSFGFGTGFGNGTFDTGWFSSTNPALFNNILNTGEITTQVLDDDPNDNYWDFRRGNNLSNNDIVTVAPGYLLEKTADPTTFGAVGDTIEYTYIVSNIGSVPIRSLSVGDDKITDVSCDKTVILDSPTPQSSGGIADFATCTGEYEITQEDFDAEQVINVAQANGTPDFGQLGTLSDNAIVTGPSIAPLISIVKDTTLTSFGNAGTTVPYTFVVSNDGDATLFNVSVSDLLLPGLVCEAAELLPDEELSCSADYTVTQTDVDNFLNNGTQLSNTAVVTSRDPNNTTLTANDMVNLDGPTSAPSFDLVKTAVQNDFDADGDVLQFNIVITNTGNVSFPSPPAITDMLTGGATCPAGPVAPTASVTCTASYTVDQDDLDVGEVDNRADATITIGGVTATDGDNAVVPAVRTEGISLDKRLAATSASSFADENVVLRYEYVVTNTGNVRLDSVTIADDKVTATCVPDTVDPGDSIVCTSADYLTTQPNLDAGNVTNIASATGTPRGGTGPITSVNDTVIVPATQMPGLGLAKDAPTLTAPQYQVNETVTYDYTVTNTGNTTITAPLSVTDDKIGTFACGTVPLAPGLSTSCSADYQLQAGDILAGAVTNAATATDGTTDSNQATATISPTLNPGIEVIKTADLAQVASTSDLITYTFEVRNAGNTQILLPDQQITVEDARVGTVDCSLQPGTLNPGDTFDCTATTTPTLAEMNAGEVVNTATASFPFISGGVTSTVRSDPSTSMVPVDAQPSMVFAKAGPAEFNAFDQQLSYTFTVTNDGNVTLARVDVTDPLIPTLSCVITDLEPTQSDSCTATYNVTQPNMDDEVILNTATAIGQPTQGPTQTETGQSTANLAAGVADKSAVILKEANTATFANVNDQIEYTFTVTNDGNQTLTNLEVRDSLDAGYLCIIPSLAPGVSNTDCTFTYQIMQSDIDAEQVFNTANVSSSEITTESDNETVSGPARNASFVFEKSTTDSYDTENDIVNFTFSVTNDGNVTLSNIQITDALFTPTLNCTIPSLLPGVTDTTTCTGAYSVTQNDVNQGSFTNTANISADAPAGVTPPPNTSSTEVVNGPTAQPLVQIVKTPSVNSYAVVGDSINYTFVVTNTGNVTLTNLQVGDPLLSFTCALDDLDPGDVATTCENGAPALAETLNVLQPQIDAGTFSNIATVTGQSLVGGTSVEDVDRVTVTGPPQNPSITLAKVADDLTPFDAVGDTIDYTYTVTNTGNITITADVTVTDDKISNVMCAPIGSGIAPLGTLTCTGTYTVDQDDLNNNLVTNIASASVTQPVIPQNPGDPAIQTVTSPNATATVAADQMPMLLLDKRIKSTSTSSYAAVGDTVVFEYFVTNTGNVTTTAPITITDNRIPGTLTCGGAGVVPGGTVLCEQSWTADQPALNAGEVTNTATASMQFGGNTVDSNTDTATVTAVQDPSLAVVKTLTSATPPGIFDENVMLDYSYVVSNDGNVTIDGPFTFADSLTTPTCSPVAPATLAPGGNFTCTGQYTMGPSDVAVGVVNNVVTISGSFDGTGVTSPSDNATYPVNVLPAITLTKVALNGGDVFNDLTDVITYRYTVTNSGNAGLIEDIFVTDDKIGRFLCKPSGTTLSVGQTFTCAVDQDYMLTQPDLDAGVVVNEAIADTLFDRGDPINELLVQSGPVTETVTLEEGPQLVVAKDVTTGNDPASVNDDLIYTITATNTGNQTLSGVTLSDPLLGALTCTVGSVAAPPNVVLLPNQVLSCTGTYTVDQDDIDGQTLPNTATGRATDPMGVGLTRTGTDNHPLVPAAPGIEVTKAVFPDPGAGIAFEALGQEVTFRVSVRNSGNVTLNNVRVTDDRVPGETCTIATIAPLTTDSSCDFVYTVIQDDIDARNGTAPDLFGGFINTARAIGQPANPGAPEIEDDGEVFARGPDHDPAFALTKIANIEEVTTAGQVITYTFTVVNIGNITLFEQPSVTDDKIGVFDCGTLPTAGLLPQEFVTCTADYTVLQSNVDAGEVVNIASVSSTEVPFDPNNPLRAETTETVDAPRTPGISITKTPSVLTGVVAEDVITYTYDVTNAGNVTLSDVTVTDQHTSASGVAALPVAGDSLFADNGIQNNSTDVGLNGIWDSLAPGDVVRFTATYEVQQEDVDQGVTLANTASVSSVSPPGTIAPSDEVDATVNVAIPGPAMAVLKTANDDDVQDPAQIGDQIVYTITVRNIGNVTLTAPVLSDTLQDADGESLSIPDPAFQGGDDDNDSNLSVGEIWTYTTTFALDQQAIDAGGVSNLVTATANDPFNTPTTDDVDDPVVTDVPRTPAIAVIKAAEFDDGGDGQADVGDTISYTYTVTNTGNVTLFDITLAETTFTGAGAAPIPALQTGGADLGGDPAVLDLPFGQSMTFTATYVLLQDDLDAIGVTNQATASGDDPDGDPVTDLSGGTLGDDTPTVTPFTAVPGLEATKTVEGSGVQTPAQIDDVITYTLSVANTGNVTLDIGSVVDTMTRADGTDTALDAPFELQSGDLDDDDRLDVTETWILTATYTLTQADLNAGGLENTVTVNATDPEDTPVTDTSDNGDDGDGNAENDPTVFTFEREPGLTVIKSVSDSTGVAPGDTVTFTIAATNTGNVDLTDLAVTDTLTRADDTVVTGATVVVQSVPDTLMPTQVATWTLTHTLTQEDINAGGLRNTATVTATPPDGLDQIEDQSADDDPSDGNDENDQTEFDIVPTPGLEVLKTIDEIGTNAGEQAIFTISARNSGNVTLTDVVVADTLTRVDDAVTPLTPDSVVFTSADGTPPSVEGTLQAGETAIWTVTYTLTQEDIDAGGLQNTATVDAVDPSGDPIRDVSDDDGDGESDPTLAEIEQNPSVALSKAGSDISILFPTVNQVTFTLELENDGNVTQTGLSLVDDLASFLTPALLLSDTYPLVVEATGFSDGGANPGYDGTTVIDTLTGNPTLAPGDVGSVTVTLVYSTATGQPAQPNVARVTSDQLPDANPSNEVVVALTDSDGDGVPDTLESPTEDRDGDGVADAFDYDPTGYFYCEENGEILSGGLITVSGPAGTQTGIGTSSNITILQDGSLGYFQFFVTAAGSYSLNITYPPAGVPSTGRPDGGAVDVTSLLPQNPASLGSSEFGSTGVLADFTAAANPWFSTFVIEAGDPTLINVNIPLMTCAGAPNVMATKAADRDTAVFGEAINYTLTFTNNTSRTYTDANIVDQLPVGLAYTPGSAQVDGVVVDPVVTPRTRLNWPNQTIAPGQTITVTYAARVTGQADFGEMTNSAWLTDATGTILSNIATASVRVEPEHVFDCSDVIGKVFDDRNRNGYQDSPTGRITDDDIFIDKAGKMQASKPDPQGEPGLPGVRLATVNGTLITTDEHGRFHVPCAELPKAIGSNFTLKLDTRTLPSGYRVTTENPRVMRLTAGKMAKMNFGATLGRVVDVDLTARAFVPGEAQPKAALAKGVDGLLEQIRQTPSVLRLSYILQKEEDADTARARLRELEKMIRQKWRGNGRYKLDIERSIKRVQ
ncbi:MAG: hypothetical protein AB8B82_10885 [Roseovarius sp.]